jgi:hypothetical protein
LSYRAKNFKIRNENKRRFVANGFEKWVLENQALKTESNKAESNVQTTILVALLILLSISLLVFGIQQVRMADPYVRQVLAIRGHVDQGHAIFQMNCSGCHGLNGNGKVGPSLRGVGDRRSRIGLIHQVTSGNTPPMPKFQASPEEMADLLSYLKTL